MIFGGGLVDGIWHLSLGIIFLSLIHVGVTGTPVLITPLIAATVVHLAATYAGSRMPHRPFPG